MLIEKIASHEIVGLSAAALLLAIGLALLIRDRGQMTEKWLEQGADRNPRLDVSFARSGSWGESRWWGSPC